MKRGVVIVMVSVLFGVGSSYASPDGPGTASAPPDVEGAAGALYGSSNLTLYAAVDAAFVDAFPSLDFYYVIEGVGFPGHTHIMAWDPFGEDAYDATLSFNDLLTLSGALIVSSSDALRYGLAYAEAANGELQVKREVVDSSDSSRLGTTIADPTATFAGGGWNVDASTWAFQNGVLASWTVVFEASRVVEASWAVDDIDVGPDGFYMGSAALEPETLVENEYSLSGHAVTASRDGRELLLPDEAEEQPFVPIPEGKSVNFDDSWWQVYYPEGLYPTITQDHVDLAVELAEAGRKAYATQVSLNPDNGSGAPSGTCDPVTNSQSNWGFQAEDPDCELVIRIDSPDSLHSVVRVFYPESGSDVETTIIVHPNFDALIKARGYFEDPVKHTRPALADLIMAHEHFHELQFAAGLRQQLNVVMEGTARFIETIYDPNVTDDRSSLWYGTHDAPYNPNGVNYFQLHPDIPMCPLEVEVGNPLYAHVEAPSLTVEHSYDYGLYYGYLYKQKNESIDVIRRIISEMAARTPTTLEDCNTKVAAAIDAALSADMDPPTSHAEALTGFGIAMYRESFAWGTPDGGDERDWGKHLLPVVKEEHVVGGGTQTHQVGAWGLQFIDLVPGADYTLIYDKTDPAEADADWTVTAVRVDQVGEVSETALSPGAPTPFDGVVGDLAAFVVAVRTAPTDGVYEMTINLA